MADLRSLLERAGEEVAPPSDAFDRLSRMRGRRGIRRRAGAAGAGLVTMVAGATMLAVAFGHLPVRPSHPPVSASGATLRACPNTADALPFGPPAQAEAGAAATALAFDRAWQRDDDGAMRRLVDPSVADPSGIAGTGPTARGPRLAGQGGQARHDPLVEGRCGAAVAAHTWFVVIDDGSGSASLDVTFYLIRRSDGWKVWGSY